MEENKHISVLLQESIDMLNIKPDGIYVDCTLGRGGHSSEVLKKIKSGFLFAIDQDLAAIKNSEERLSKISNNFKILKGNFQEITSLLAINDTFEVDGILFDLGVSSPQFDIPERGFSYRFNGPLDMRMNQNIKLTAHKIVNEFDEKEIREILWKYGDEKFAPSIAKNIILHRPINNTLELVEVIKKSMPQKVLKKPKHPAKKTFQALRIFVNDEINVLKNALTESLNLLKPKSRIVVITFHSLEENIVKEVFKKVTISKQDEIIKSLPIHLESDSKFKLVIKKPIRPNNSELEINKRAHSSKLWVIEKK